MWTQTDFELLAGFNLYRATNPDGDYTRINSAMLPPDQRDFRDYGVEPGQPHYYKFTVVQTSMAESDFSNVAVGTPIDTIPPAISHNPLTSAAPGLPLTIHADVTDNVAVQSATLYHRPIGESQFSSRNMTRTTGDRYAATLEGSLVVGPGLEYYIQASDGINLTRHGQPSNPHQITVDNKPAVTSVSPNHGPMAGGTTVTIAGSLFQSGATVYFGGMAADNVTVINSNQITAVTPPHFPTQVDVTVTNPDGESGTLLQGFTYQSTAVQLSLPDASGGQLDVVEIPINAANVQGLAAADIRIAYDPDILSAQGATTGSLTPGWSLAVNTNTPGLIILSMASPGGTVSGSGTIARLEFQVDGEPGSSSDLDFDYVSLNDGAIPTETAAGSFTVDEVYAISGGIQFWHGDAGVPGTLLRLVGDRVYTAISDVDGSYTVSGAQADDYILTPSKADDVDGISAYDASLALQHAAGLITLTGYQATAADVNRSGSITAMDAYYILQHAAGLLNLPFPGAGAVWLFNPASRSYTDLNADQVDQNFAAVLLGDPSGNWSPPAPDSAPPEGMPASQPLTATLSLPQVDILPDQTLTVPLALTLPEGDLFAADISLVFDPAVITITNVSNGALADGWSLAANLTEPGLARIAMAGAMPITSDGELLLLTLEAVGVSGDESGLILTQAELNEGMIPSAVEHGQVRIAYPALAGFVASPLSGPAPLTVVFTNTSTGDFDVSLWEFGDGGTSSVENPSHIFELPGVYTVTLTVSGPGGQSILVRANYIVVSTVSISGELQYWSESQPIGGATLTLVGSAVYTTTSQASGDYFLSGLLVDDYVLMPSKDGEARGISAYDASLVLQHAAGVITLEGHAATAADVNRSGDISSLDASYILQKAVGLIELPFPGADRVWDFDPPARTYPDLNTNLTGQSFTTILLGDPSGNWSPTETMAMVNTTAAPTTLSLPILDVEPGGQALATLQTSAPEEPVYAIDLLITYDPTVVAATAVTLSTTLSDWMLAESRSIPGEIRVALAGVTPLGGGELAQISFQAVGAVGAETPLAFVQADLNDGVLPTLLEDGLLRIGEPDGDFQLYLPITVNAAVGQTANAPSARAASIFEMVRQSRPGYYRWSEMAR
jgi:PKD repeat protein